MHDDTRDRFLVRSYGYAIWNGMGISISICLCSHARSQPHITLLTCCAEGPVECCSRSFSARTNERIYLIEKEDISNIYIFYIGYWILLSGIEYQYEFVYCHSRQCAERGRVEKSAKQAQRHLGLGTKRSSRTSDVVEGVALLPRLNRPPHSRRY